MPNEENKIPTMYMMVGLPGSGKTYIANRYYGDCAIHSSDQIRAELYGDASCQENNEKVFRILHSRIKEDLKNGKDVVYDATNIKKRRRADFLRELRNIPCIKQCCVVMTPYEKCLENNQMRERKVPEEVIRRMYLNWEPPHWHEGFDFIDTFFNRITNDEINAHYNFEKFISDYADYDQGTPYHNLMLGEHCRRTAMKIAEEIKWADLNIMFAGAIHDCGKPFTRTESDGCAHYYQHHCVSAYLSLFYTYGFFGNVEYETDIANLIYFHMHPFRQWKDSKKAEHRDIQMIGEHMYNRIMILHKADANAHD